MDLWTEIAKQVPSLSVLAGVVWMFLKSLNSFHQQVEKITVRTESTIEGLSDSYKSACATCHVVQMKAVAALESNNIHLEQASDKMEKLDETLKDVKNTYSSLAVVLRDVSESKKN